MTGSAPLRGRFDGGLEWLLPPPAEERWGWALRLGFRILFTLPMFVLALALGTGWWQVRAGPVHREPARLTPPPRTLRTMGTASGAAAATRSAPGAR